MKTLPTRSKTTFNSFPWDAIHIESFADALLNDDLPGYYQRQERAAQKLYRYQLAIRKKAIKKAAQRKVV